MRRRPEDPAQLGLFQRAENAEAPDEARGTASGAARGTSNDAALKPEQAEAASTATATIDHADIPLAPPPAQDRRFIDGPLPDEPARQRIREDLETNLLVEAGAGSGKTTALVERMVALVASGTATVDELAAVTFTRKAAAELRQRFQTALEAALSAARVEAGSGAPPSPSQGAESPGAASSLVGRLDRALRHVDRATIGTIHSFCARLLRERPVEAGLDPDFRELMGAEEVRQRRAFWRNHLEQIAAAEDPLVARLSDVGLAPSQLETLFDERVANPDVRFPAAPSPAPSHQEVEAVRRRLDALLDRGRATMPAEPAERGWDKLQARIRLLLFLRRVVDWDDDTVFLDQLGDEVFGRSCDVVQNRWPDGAAAKQLSIEWSDLRDGAAADLLDRWWAHRYPIAMEFAGRAAAAFAAERRRAGTVTFQDLLMLAARLLRDHPRAREELGRRYRRLLVDEFQDTDPVQAEVLLLLTSPPGEDDWQASVPRPGALFVVGDPKQSIYRFRRADISVYNLVRDRFGQWGDVLELVANFRSLPPIGELVEGAFGEDGRFGDEATPYQAAFAPLRTRRVPEPGLPSLLEYRIEPDGRSYSAAAQDGARRLVPWIADRVAEGRSPGDFLILARQKAELATYARELEAWRIPVQVTGAGVDQMHELRELLVLLEALADPTEPVRVVAVLVGLLFGLDMDQLLDWVLDDDGQNGDSGNGNVRRRFDITRPHGDDPTPVGRALHRLHGWWDRSRTEPADVLVGRIVDEVGLVPLAAARDMGEIRAGSLLFALDVLRVAALAGDTSIATATEALRTALEADEAEAPLEPVRRGVVRVMTLHQAKGLEAPVVALVHPVGRRDYPVTRHIQRGDDGSAVGHLVVQEQEGYQTRVIARPLGWEEREAEERLYERAEQDRLLYVAATRAGEQLVVARKAGDESSSPWQGLYPWIGRLGVDLRLEPRTAPEPEPMPHDAATLERAIARLRDHRMARAEPTFDFRTATTLAKGAADPGAGVGMTAAAPGPGAPEAALHRPEPPEAGSKRVQPPRLPDQRDGPDPSFRGLSWGIAVHGALDAAARGAAGDDLRRVARGVLLEAERPVRDGEPEELEELVGLVERVLESDVWRRAHQADRRLSEVPFAYREPPAAGGNGPVRIMEGVVDLAFREEDGWVLVDYKTDVGTDPDFERRHQAYVRQVELYAGAWEALTGEPVRERVLFYTARPRDEAEVTW